MVQHPKTQLANAIRIAATLHVNQFDKGGRPYILHPLKVMHYLKEKGDDELSCIAVLHDIKEDCGVSDNYLVDAGFSQRVVEGVNHLTKVEGQPLKEYMLGILNSYDACRVKLADLRHNTDVRRLKGLREKDLQRVKKYHTLYMMISEMIVWYENLDNMLQDQSPEYFKVLKGAKVKEILNAY